MEQIKIDSLSNLNNASTLPEPVKKGQESIVVNQIQIRTADRSRKDVGDWKNYWITAASVYYPNRTQLYDLYETVEIDGFLSGIVSKRIDTVLNKSFHFQGKDGKRIEELDAFIESDNFRKICKIILETHFWGISGLEFIPGKELDFKTIPRKHIKPKWGIIAEQQNGYTGFEYAKMPNIWVIGEPTDLGLYLKCAPYALLKRGNLADWGQFVEIFGQPMRVIKYDAFDTQAKVELKEVLDESGSSLALMIPKTADFELMDGKSSNANGDLQDKFKDALNDELSICVLGNTETTSNNKGGTNAKSNTQRKEQLEITKSDIKFLTGKLNSVQFIGILKSYGFPVDGGKFVAERELDLLQIKAQIDIAKAAKDMGVPVEDDYIYDITGIPKPNNYDDLKNQLKESKPSKQPKPTPQTSSEDDDPNESAAASIWDRFKAKFSDFFELPR